tara:strand:+ start:382 stop:576 length:195 start_codon:yes stop_codon:yes gene_type:complete
MKKNSLKHKIEKLNQHIANLHNRLSNLEVVVSAYVEMRRNGKKLKKYLDKKAKEVKEDENNTTV